MLRVSRLFLSPPDVGRRERELLLDAFDSNWIAPLGPHVDAFEREFAEFVGVRHAAALSSGTAALHLALVLLGVGAGRRGARADAHLRGDAPTRSPTSARRRCSSTASAATLEPRPDAARGGARRRARAAGRLPAAVIVVDLYGQCADYDADRWRRAPRYGVPLIEDAAEALGATYRGRPAGSFGALGVFSFNGNKIITTSGGGMLVGRRPGARSSGPATSPPRRATPRRTTSTREIGFNYRLSNLLAAVGRGAARRRSPAKVAAPPRRSTPRYRAALADVPGHRRSCPNAPDGEPTNWLTVITLDRAVRHRPRCGEHLEALDIEARPAWKPMHLQPVFADCEMRGGAVARGDLPRRASACRAARA